VGTAFAPYTNWQPLDALSDQLANLLRSSKEVHQAAAQPTMQTRRTPPDPGLGAMIQLLGGQHSNLANLLGVSEGLPGEGLAAEEPPPAFWEIEPTRAFGDEDVVNPGMGLQPRDNRRTRMARKIEE
jgi:hypothetical protein